MKRLWTFALVLLLAGLVPAVLAQGPMPEKPPPAPQSVAQPAEDLTLGWPAFLMPAPAPLALPPAEVQAGGSPEAILDDFNRADGPIGPDWTVHDGFCNVSSNAAVCGSMGRATFNDYVGDGNAAEADVEAVGTALQYTGLLLNYGAGVSNLFLKVQQQNASGQFSHAGCYTGNNGPAFGLGFFALSSPFTTAHMRATRVGNDVTIEFTNIDGGAQPPQTYVCSGAPAPEGTGIGILGYAGIARLDNFGVPGAGLLARKEAPANVWSGGTMRYTITVQAPAIVPGMYLSLIHT